VVTPCDKRGRRFIEPYVSTGCRNLSPITGHLNYKWRMLASMRRHQSACWSRLISCSQLTPTAEQKAAHGRAVGRSCGGKAASPSRLRTSGQTPALTLRNFSHQASAWHLPAFSSTPCPLPELSSQSARKRARFLPGSPNGVHLRLRPLAVVDSTTAYPLQAVIPMRP
jgi:hypothetical protein